jgi:hypothetical protein
VLVLLVVVAAVFAEAIYMAETWGAGYANSHGSFWVFYLALALVLALVLTFLILTLVSQLIFFRQRAVWLDGENIVYLASWFSCTPRHEIENVLLGSFGKFKRPGIQIRLRDGRTKSIPIELLLEPPDVVLDRLQRFVSRR